MYDHQKTNIYKYRLIQFRPITISHIYKTKLYKIITSTSKIHFICPLYNRVVGGFLNISGKQRKQHRRVEPGTPLAP